jgi:hypothetical protein
MAVSSQRSSSSSSSPSAETKCVRLSPKGIPCHGTRLYVLLGRQSPALPRPLRPWATRHPSPIQSYTGSTPVPQKTRLLCQALSHFCTICAEDGSEGDPHRATIPPDWCRAEALGRSYSLPWGLRRFSWRSSRDCVFFIPSSVRVRGLGGRLCQCHTSYGCCRSIRRNPSICCCQPASRAPTISGRVLF